MDPNNTIVRRQVQSVIFGFYTDEDVRSRSVVEITSPLALDRDLGTPLPGGLYDGKMGPIDSSSGGICETCACSYVNCPGHSGHLELCVPVYHPLLFGSMIKLLRAKCLHCHELRAPKQELETLKTQFALLDSGRLQEALELEANIRHVSRQARENRGETSVAAAVQTAIQEFLQGVHERPVSRGSTHSDSSSLERRTRRTVQQLLLSSCLQRKKCEHCGAFSPKIRQDSNNKVFQSVLSLKQARINASEGIVIAPALEYEEKKRTGYDSDDSLTGHQRTEPNMDSDEEDEDDEEQDKPDDTPSKDRYMTSFEIQAQVKLTWEKQPLLCAAFWGGGPEGFRRFFLRAIPVPPSRFRPLMMLGTLKVEHSQNVYLNKLLTLNERIRSLLVDSETNAYTAWIELQTTVNCFMDSSKDPSATASGNVNPGIRQILEKKEGIFRKHMMGKRVDFACRSVISPDPYVGTNEIGIPLHFAKTLTYPTPVTDLNFVEMRRLVERGASNHPGASWVRFPDGRRIDLSRMDDKRRESVAARLVSSIKKGGPPVVVGRQLRNGDMMLVNRQPTLHKPGIMAHSVRMLHDQTQKTIRMHYANCNTYNADFDGDEMNCHFPQNDIASAESKFIAATDLQYIVPTDGSPLRGLIQDHVDAGVKMTGKDTFLERWEYQQLVFASLTSLPGLELIRSDADIELLPPAVEKPRELWTGKQVLSTLLHHLRKGNDQEDVGSRKHEFPGISVERKAKTPEHGFGASQKEHLVIIRDGELLRGVLDKAAFGSTEFSLVHAVYEAYGARRAGLLLNSLGRLFTAYLQYYSGHSCRMEDLILTKEADAARRKLVNRAYSVGSRAAKAWADSEGGKVQIEPVKDKEGADKPLKPVESAAASAKIGQLLSGSEGKEKFAALDGYMQSQLNPLASEIIKACLPNGLAVPFPANTFGLMVTTGAKGSTVNQSQVSCALGQQALEGRRVPRLSSGRTLPSFAPYDPNPRADGFIMDRFLTGIRPQEYYFHCMAGREGLVDTAVKTSRSGYLQRCLVKHLEELKVCYDSTVRNSDGGVVQFLYGEDGLDPTKATYLDCSSRSFEYMASNREALNRCNVPLPDSSIDIAARDVQRQSTTVQGRFEVGSYVEARRLRVGAAWTRGALCKGWFSAIVAKCHNNGSYQLRYLQDGHTVSHVPVEVDLGPCGARKTDAISSTCILIRSALPDPLLSGAKGPAGSHRIGVSGACVSERVAGAASSALKTDNKLRAILKASGLSSEDFGSLVAAKYASSLCAPGEAVGSIAAQSVGEPSTQMTLNTFHLAGSGANVTLGIPRLREIIMTASKELKTPTMSVPLLDSISDKEAVRLTRSFTKLTLMELISSHGGVQVREALEQDATGTWQRAYHITLKMHPSERMKEAFGLTLEAIASVATEFFIPSLAEIMKKEIKRSATNQDDEGGTVQGGEASHFVESEITPAASERDELDDDDDDDNKGGEEDDDDAMGEEDGVNASRFGNREEMTSYGPMDVEDEETAHESDMSDEDEGTKGNPPPSSNVGNENDNTATTAPSFGSNTLKIDRASNSFILRPLKVDPSVRPLLMVGLVERAASSTLVRSRPKIQQAFINNEDEANNRCLQTAGVNFEELWKLDGVVDHNRLTSNDIWAVCCSYGVEAARRTIVDQIRGVFGAYGISVDPRHLSLIADYMTFEGDFKAMNRGGMADVGSPFLQMSFETTATFMTEAANHARKESLMSPSGNIVMGRPIRHGTGAFDVLVK